MPGTSLNNNRSGYVIIESFIAITIIVVGLLGIFSLLSQSLSLNHVVSDRYVASFLAAEGAEIIKNITDNNSLAGRVWNDGLTAGRYQIDYTATELPSACDTSCQQVFFFDTQEHIYSYAPTGKRTNFRRVITLEPLTDGEGVAHALRVNSVVSWQSRGGSQFEVNVEDIFYNYR